MDALVVFIIVYLTIGHTFAITSCIINLDNPHQNSPSAYFINFMSKVLLWPKYIFLLFYLLLFFPKK